MAGRESRSCFCESWAWRGQERELTPRPGRLEESGIVTRCEITTYEPDELMDLPFDDELRVQKLIMKVRLFLPVASRLVRS